MEVFFQQEDAVAFFLFIITLIAFLLLFLFPYLVWRISARLKQNGDRLQEISNRLENMLVVLAPPSTHAADMTPSAESSDEQTPFNFDADDEDASIAEIEPFSAVPFDAAESRDAANMDDDDETLEFDFSDDFDTPADFSDSENRDDAEAAAVAGDLDSTDEHPPAQPSTAANDLESPERFDTSEKFEPADALDKKEETDLADSFTFEPAADLWNRDELDLSGESDSTDDFSNREDRGARPSLDRTDQESNSEELGQTAPQENVTAATLSLDTDFALKSPTPKFASGPDDEFGFEFEGDFGDLGDPIPSSLDDKTPLTFNEISADFSTDQLELEESSFTFETAEEPPSGSLDAFADIEFSEEAPADFETLEPEPEENRPSETLDNSPDIDFTEKSTADASDEESTEEPQPETSKYAGFTFATPSFRAPAESTAKEEIQEDFAAAFDEIEPSLSSEALDDIAASILKDQESPPPIKPETAPEIQPEPAPAPKPPPAAKPATLFARCEGCNHKLAYKETLSGKRVRCPACSVAFKLP